jgi:hypothetical protein
MRAVSEKHACDKESAGGGAGAVFGVAVPVGSDAV